MEDSQDEKVLLEFQDGGRILGTPSGIVISEIRHPLGGFPVTLVLEGDAFVETVFRHLCDIKGIQYTTYRITGVGEPPAEKP